LFLGKRERMARSLKMNCFERERKKCGKSPSSEKAPGPEKPWCIEYANVEIGCKVPEETSPVQ
jgi:hypothetical protein